MLQILVGCITSTLGEKTEEATNSSIGLVFSVIATESFMENEHVENAHFTLNTNFSDRFQVAVKGQIDVERGSETYCKNRIVAASFMNAT